MSEIRESEKQKLAGILLDRNLCFNKYIFSQCKKASRKLSPLISFWKFMAIKCRRILMEVFIESQSGYSLFV